MEAIRTYFEGLFCDPRHTAGQIVGFGMIAAALFIYSFRKRQHVLIGKLVSDSVSVVHYSLLEAYSGAAIAGICIFREIIFYQKGKWKFVSRPWVAFAFGAVLTAASVLTWAGPVSLLPLFGSLLAVAGFWCTKPLRMRLVMTVAILLYFAYSILIGSVSGIVTNIFSLISLGVGIAKDLHPKAEA